MLEACLERIEARDGELRAWAYLDPEATLAQARTCDARAPAGPLHGVASSRVPSLAWCPVFAVAAFEEAVEPQTYYKNQDDRDHWLEGYRKAGLDV